MENSKVMVSTESGTCGDLKIYIRELINGVANYEVYIYQDIEHVTSTIHLSLDLQIRVSDKYSCSAR